MNNTQHPTLQQLTQQLRETFPQIQQQLLADWSLFELDQESRLQALSGLQRTAHSLAGAVGLYGFHELYLTAVEFESALSLFSRSEIDAMQLQSRLKNLSDALHAAS